ncbi:MAG: hypothetical protein ABWX83_08480 [Luteibacter sp.]
MTPPKRSSRPSCPACRFPVFNRRCAKCEKCGAVLPDTIAYTAQEIAALRAVEQREEEQRERRRAKAQELRASRARRFVDSGARGSTIVDVLEGGLDLLSSND